MGVWQARLNRSLKSMCRWRRAGLNPAATGLRPTARLRGQNLLRTTWGNGGVEVGAGRLRAFVAAISIAGPSLLMMSLSAPARSVVVIAGTGAAGYFGD